MNKPDNQTVSLQPLTAADRDLFVALYGDPWMMRYIFKPLQAEQADDLMLDFLRLAAGDPPRALIHKVISETQGEVGVIGASTDDPEVAVFDAGVMIGQAFKGHGYGTAAFRELMAIMRQTAAIRAVRAQSMTANLGAYHMMTKLGYDIEQTTEDEQGISWHHWLYVFTDDREDGA